MSDALADALADADAELMRAGWATILLNGKVPFKGSNGLLDGTTDLAVGKSRRAGKRHANIGAPVPESLVAVDIDPRHDGWASLARLEDEHGPLPVTLTVRTGGADRGEHRYFLRPPGPIANAKLGAGIDLRLPGKHYTVMPPSIHPETGRAYEWVDVTVAPVLPPAWLVALLLPPAAAPIQPRSLLWGGGDRPGDLLAASVTWREILVPHGWTFAGSKGDVGYWRRPGKLREGISATTNALGTDRLHVVSSNASPFEPNESYSKFGAFALLEHAGDFVAAARVLRKEAVSA